MKQTLLAVFGGRSTEHEISCKSVVNIVGNIDTEKYDVILAGITKEGDSWSQMRKGGCPSGRWM